MVFGRADLGSLEFSTASRVDTNSGEEMSYRDVHNHDMSVFSTFGEKVSLFSAVLDMDKRMSLTLFAIAPTTHNPF